jgi:hypothetical protein
MNVLAQGLGKSFRFGEFLLGLARFRLGSVYLLQDLRAFLPGLLGTLLRVVEFLRSFMQFLANLLGSLACRRERLLSFRQGLTSLFVSLARLCGLRLHACECLLGLSKLLAHRLGIMPGRAEILHRLAKLRQHLCRLLLEKLQRLASRVHFLAYRIELPPQSIERLTELPPVLFELTEILSGSSQMTMQLVRPLLRVGPVLFQASLAPPAAGTLASFALRRPAP